LPWKTKYTILLDIKEQKETANIYITSGSYSGTATDRVDVLHALCCLPRDVDQSVHRKLDLLDMQVLVEAGAVTPLRDDREERL